MPSPTIADLSSVTTVGPLEVELTQRNIPFVKWRAQIPGCPHQGYATGDLHLAFLDVEDCIGRVSLLRNNLILAVLTNASALANLGETVAKICTHPNMSVFLRITRSIPF